MNLIVQELKGLSHVLTLTDGSTFRIFSRERKEVSNKLISKEFNALQSIGSILLVPKTEKKEAPTIKINNRNIKKEVKNNE